MRSRRNVVVNIWPHTKPRNHSCEAITILYFCISWVNHWDEVKDGAIIRLYSSWALDGIIGHFEVGNDMSGYMPGISISGSRPTLVLSNSQLVRGLQDIGEIHQGFAKRIRLAIRQPLVDLGTRADMDRIKTCFWKFCSWLYPRSCMKPQKLLHHKCVLLVLKHYPKNIYRSIKP